MWPNPQETAEMKSLMENFIFCAMILKKLTSTALVNALSADV